MGNGKWEMGNGSILATESIRKPLIKASFVKENKPALLGKTWPGYLRQKLLDTVLPSSNGLAAGPPLRQPQPGAVNSRKVGGAYTLLLAMRIWAFAVFTRLRR